jgi:hypothetical protein
MLQAFVKNSGKVLMGLISTTVTVMFFFQDTYRTAYKAHALAQRNESRITSMEVTVVDRVGDKMLKMQLDIIGQMNARFDEQSRRLNKIESKLGE